MSSLTVSSAMDTLSPTSSGSASPSTACQTMSMDSPPISDLGREEGANKIQERIKQREARRTKALSFTFPSPTDEESFHVARKGSGLRDSTNASSHGSPSRRSSKGDLSSPARHSPLLSPKAIPLGQPVFGRDDFDTAKSGGANRCDLMGRSPLSMDDLSKGDFEIEHVGGKKEDKKKSKSSRRSSRPWMFLPGVGGKSKDELRERDSIRRGESPRSPREEKPDIIPFISGRRESYTAGVSIRKGEEIRSDGMYGSYGDKVKKMGGYMAKAEREKEKERDEDGGPGDDDATLKIIQGTLSRKTYTTARALLHFVRSRIFYYFSFVLESFPGYLLREKCAHSHQLIW